MSANCNSIASCLGLSRTARWLRFPFERRPFWGVTFVGDVGVFPFAGDVGIFPMSHGTNTGRSAQRTRYVAQVDADHFAQVADRVLEDVAVLVRAARQW